MDPMLARAIATVGIWLGVGLVGLGKNETTGTAAICAIFATLFVWFTS